jgi:hypothetical protein
VKKSFWKICSYFAWENPESKIVGSEDRSIIIFKRNDQSISESLDNFLLYQQGMNIISPYLLINDLYSHSLIIVPLLGINEYLILALTCISVITNEVENIPMSYLLFIFLLIVHVLYLFLIRLFSFNTLVFPHIF